LPPFSSHFLQIPSDCPGYAARIREAATALAGWRNAETRRRHRPLAGRRSNRHIASSRDMTPDCGEEIGPSFSEVVNKKLDNTSKKLSRTAGNWSEGDSWVAGL